MLIVGLTGSIGMGKTTTASAFRRLGVFVHNSDLAVHELLGIGRAAVQAVASEFPGVREGNGINRAKLGQIVFSDRSRLHELENILHPLVADHRRRFLMSASRRRERMVVLDVPLLFETGSDANCDVVITVWAPVFIQLRRVLARPEMNKERFNHILANQMPEKEKRRRSDFIVPTGLGHLESLRRIRKIIMEVSQWPPRHWPPRIPRWRGQTQPQRIC